MFILIALVESGGECRIKYARKHSLIRVSFGTETHSTSIMISTVVVYKCWGCRLNEPNNRTGCKRKWVWTKTLQDFVCYCRVKQECWSSIPRECSCSFMFCAVISNTVWWPKKNRRKPTASYCVLYHQLCLSVQLYLGFIHTERLRKRNFLLKAVVFVWILRFSSVSAER